MPVAMREVQSSAIESIGYDSDTKTLYIQFKGKSAYPAYQYAPVGAHTAGRMLTASSVGSYYHRIIKPRRHYQTSPSSRQIKDIMEERNSGSLVDIALKAAKENFLGEL